MATTKLYPPTISGVLPAFYRNYDVGGSLTGAVLEIPYTMNRAVSYSDISGFAIRIKTVNTDTVVVTSNTKSYTTDTNIVTFTLSASDALLLNVGQFYKIQLAYLAKTTETIGYFSSVGTIKCVSKPNVSILNQTEYVVNLFALDYTGKYEQTAKSDFTEKAYSYCFNLYDNYDNLIYTTGTQLHNTSNDAAEDESIDTCSIKENIIDNTIYQIEYIVTTVNGLTLSSPKYKVMSSPSIGFEKDISISAVSDTDEGYIIINFEGEKQSVPVFDSDVSTDEWVVKYDTVEALCNGSFLLSRSSNQDNFSTWLELDRFKLSGEVPSSHPFYDYTVEQGVSYKYSLQQYNAKGVYSIRNESEIVFADFEDAYLFDGTQSLRIRFDPKLSSFKTTHLETKIDTIGSQYPYIFRNGNVGYKEFPISGLISYQMDINHRFIDWEDLSSTEYTNTDLIAENITMERDFKLQVLDWLNNGEVKLFRSPTEGNYLVRLMNVSLSPNDVLGRMLHTFSCTAYEVAECTYANLVDYNIVKVDEIAATTSVMWQTIELNSIGINNEVNGLSIPEGSYYSLSCENFAPGDIIKINFVNSSYDTTIAIGADGNYFLSFDEPLIKRMTLVSGQTDVVTPRTILVSSAGDEIHEFDIIANVSLQTIPFQQFMSNQCFGLDQITYCPVGTNLVDELNVHIGSEEYGINKVELVKFENLTLRKRSLIPVFKYNNKYHLPYNNFCADSLVDLCNGNNILSTRTTDEYIITLFHEESNEIKNYLQQSGADNLFSNLYLNYALSCFNSTDMFVILDFNLWKKYFDVCDDNFDTIEDAIDAVTEAANGLSCVIGYVDPVSYRRTNKHKTYFHYNNVLQFQSELDCMDEDVLLSDYGTRAYISQYESPVFQNYHYIDKTGLSLDDTLASYYKWSYLDDIARNILYDTEEYPDKLGYFMSSNTTGFSADLKLASEVFKQVSFAIFGDEISLPQESSTTLGSDAWASAVRDIAKKWIARESQIINYFNFITLEDNDELQLSDLSDINGIYFENGILLEGTYQIRVTDLLIEETNTAVAAAKEKYLNYKNRLSELMDLYYEANEKYQRARVELSQTEDNETAIILTKTDDGRSTIANLISNIDELEEEDINAKNYINNKIYEYSYNRDGDRIELSITFRKFLEKIANKLESGTWVVEEDETDETAGKSVINLSFSPNDFNYDIFAVLIILHIIDADNETFVLNEEKIEALYDTAEELLGEYYLTTQEGLYEDGEPIVTIWDSEVSEYTTYEQLWIANRDYEEELGIYSSYLDIIEQIKKDVQTAYCETTNTFDSNNLLNNSLVDTELQIFTKIQGLLNTITTDSSYAKLKTEIEEKIETFKNYSTALPYLWYLTAYLSSGSFDLAAMKEPSTWYFSASKRLDENATADSDDTKKQQALYYSIIKTLRDVVKSIQSTKQEDSQELTAFKLLWDISDYDQDSYEQDDALEKSLNASRLIYEKYVAQLEAVNIDTTMSTDEKNAKIDDLTAKMEVEQNKIALYKSQRATAYPIYAFGGQTGQMEKDRGFVEAAIKDEMELLKYLTQVAEEIMNNYFNRLNTLAINKPDTAWVQALTNILIEKNVFEEDTPTGQLLNNNLTLTPYLTTEAISNLTQIELDTIDENKYNTIGISQVIADVAATGWSQDVNNTNSILIKLDTDNETLNNQITQEMREAIRMYIAEYLYFFYKGNTNIFIAPTTITTTETDENGNTQIVDKSYLPNIFFGTLSDSTNFGILLSNFRNLSAFNGLVNTLSTYFTKLYAITLSDIEEYTEMILNLTAEQDVVESLRSETNENIINNAATMTDDELDTQQTLLNDLDKLISTLQIRMKYYRMRLERAQQAYNFYTIVDPEWIPTVGESEYTIDKLAAITKIMNDRYNMVQEFFDDNSYILKVFASNQLCNWEQSDGTSDSGSISIPSANPEDEESWVYSQLTYEDEEGADATQHSFGYIYNEDTGVHEYAECGSLRLWLKHKIAMLSSDIGDLSAFTDEETGFEAILEQYNPAIENQLEIIWNNRQLFDYLLDVIDETEKKVDQAQEAQKQLKTEVKQLQKVLSIDPYVQYWETEADVTGGTANKDLTEKTYVRVERDIEDLWNDFIILLNQAYEDEVESRYNR